MLLMHDAGARAGEILKLRLPGIESHSRELIVGVEGKGGKLRQIPLMDATCA
ncbi:MAG: hypothetical protein LBU32_05970 [Clostridiales bacterium]|jgi:site-specific recombinase XerC|nr:hypothetical protein [Clostridiales bacterium]